MLVTLVTGYVPCFTRLVCNVSRVESVSSNVFFRESSVLFGMGLFHLERHNKKHTYTYIHTHTYT